MKRWIVLLMLLLCLSAAAEETVSTQMACPVTSAVQRTAQAWLATDETRAELVSRLWEDYQAVPDAKNCGMDSLMSPTLTGTYQDYSFLLVVIPCGNEWLTILYLPEYGEAHFLWESGGYDLSLKAEALREYNMTVWENLPVITRTD